MFNLTEEKVVAKRLAKEEKNTRRNCELLTSAHCKKLLEREGKCRKCGRTEMLTIDHIIPKIILRNFMDIEREVFLENYQVICRPCNVLKSGQFDFSIPETKELLLKLLERV